MSWSTPIGITILFFAFIAAIILYFVKKKWSPVLYLVSISFYTFTVLFIIDVYDTSRLVTLLLLVLSAIIMIYLGFHFSKRHDDNQEQKPVEQQTQKPSQPAANAPKIRK